MSKRKNKIRLPEDDLIDPTELFSATPETEDDLLISPEMEEQPEEQRPDVDFMDEYFSDGKENNDG